MYYAVIKHSGHFPHFTPHGRYELNKLPSLPMRGFIAQLVEYRTGIAEVTCSNPVEALIFFRLLLSNCLNWKNLLRWSFFAFIYNRSSNMNYFIYSSQYNSESIQVDTKPKYMVMFCLWLEDSSVSLQQPYRLWIPVTPTPSIIVEQQDSYKTSYLFEKRVFAGHYR